MREIDRRTFLGLCLGTAGAAVTRSWFLKDQQKIAPLVPDSTPTQTPPQPELTPTPITDSTGIEPPSTPVEKQLTEAAQTIDPEEEIKALRREHVSSRSRRPTETPIPPLEQYLSTIRPLQNKLRTAVVSQPGLFRGFKNLSPEATLEDFDIYFPIYRGAQEKYNIPWFLLWIVHTHETTVSRDKNPEESGYRGAMQRSSQFYPDEIARTAAQGWEFLTTLKQRYHKARGSKTTDYEEILWSASKMSADAQIIQKKSPSFSFEASFLQAQYRYCRQDFAAQREAQYWKVKRLLNAG